MEGGRSEVELRAHAMVWNHIFRFISSMSLKCTIDLGVADAIHRHGGPTSVSDLACALGMPAEKIPALGQLMRLMAHSGFFDVIAGDSEGRDAVKYKLNITSSFLVHFDNNCNTGISSVKPFALAMLDRVLTDPWHALAAWFREGSDVPNPFEMVHNTSFWGMASTDPKFNRLFNDAMASDANFMMAAVAARGECREVFSKLRSLVDVGGGTGVAAKALVNAFPGLECTVLELPHVVAEAAESERVKLVAGDMFQFVPPADAVLLKSILHDWRDEDCVRILRKCKEAILTNGGGKVILIDMVLSQTREENMHIENQYFFDLLMMTLLSGKERTEIEWSKLFKLAGFSRYKIISTLGQRSLMEIYP